MLVIWVCVMQMIFILYVLTLEELKIILEIDSTVKWNFKKYAITRVKNASVSKSSMVDVAGVHWAL